MELKEVETWFNARFNDLSFENYQKIEGEDSWQENILYPSKEILEKELEDEGNDKKDDDFEAILDERQNNWSPIWGTIFEAKDASLSDWIEGHINELYDIRIGVLQATDNLNACLFIAGAGYDFYDAHWIPLYKLITKH